MGHLLLLLRVLVCCCWLVPPLLLSLPLTAQSWSCLALKHLQAAQHGCYFVRSRTCGLVQSNRVALDSLLTGLANPQAAVGQHNMLSTQHGCTVQLQQHFLVSLLHTSCKLHASPVAFASVCLTCL